MPEIKKAASNKKARIEIIPLIDVIFFLLATFVLFTLSLNKITLVPIELPQATNTKSDSVPEVTTVQVSSEGTLFWDREPITMNELPQRLAALKKNKPDPRVLVAGDAKASYGEAVQVLDAVRVAGIGKVSIQTTVRDTGK